MGSTFLRRRAPAWAGLLLACLGATAATADSALIRADDLKEWLSYIASDELQGRANYSTGLGLAAAYIGDHLRSWQVTPAGDGGSYFQTVLVQDVRAISHSTVTVRVGGETRVFHDGDGVSFPPQAGKPRSFTADRVEFAGYGLDDPDARHMDFRSKDIRGALVVWLGAEGPGSVDAQRHRRILEGRSRHIVEELGALATITDGAVKSAGTATGSAAWPEVPDFVTSERLDKAIPPTVQADNSLLDFLFRGAPASYADLKKRADAREPLPAFRLSGASVTFDIDVKYEVVRTQRTYNVVGIVEGSDAALRNSYVAFGAHYDHVGYAQGEPRPGGVLQPPLFGRVTPGADRDHIWNGADDDGSGTVALMAMARAFSQGPRPRRSLLFVWHTGEEIGAYGSRYFADYPTVSIDSIGAQLNVDMVGRNRDDKPTEGNTIYLVGADRISTELDDISQRANRALRQPMVLSREMNSLSDPEQIYYRSDHYSYAAHGIPVIFFTTGLHPDYHTNTDDVSRILFDKLTRATQLVYETGLLLANLDHAPVRDNLGPRASR